MGPATIADDISESESDTIGDLDHSSSSAVYRRHVERHNAYKRAHTSQKAPSLYWCSIRAQIIVEVFEVGAVGLSYQSEFVQ